MDAEVLLLVEDDATTREVLTLLLEADGWAVRGVGSGEAALEAVGGGAVQAGVILCDLNLPGLQGPALAEAMRPVSDGALLVAMSASEAGANGSGYDAVLRKPFGPAELRAALDGLRAGRALEVRGVSPHGEEGARESELPVLSMDTFLKLEQQMGGRARELYAFALADAGDRLRRIEQSNSSGDLEAARREAHQLKGSAGMIGAESLAALAASAEMGLESLYLSKKVQEMHRACDAIRLMLETLFPM